MKLHKVKRQVAGHLLLQMFLAQNSVTHALTRVVAGGPHPDALGDGLTEQEREVVRKLIDRMAKDKQMMYRLGHRFLGRKV